MVPSARRSFAFSSYPRASNSYVHSNADDSEFLSQSHNFLVLMNTLKGNWAEVSGCVKPPTMALTRLHLETVALIRALHGNHQTDASSVEPQMGCCGAEFTAHELGSIGSKNSRKMQRRRRKAARVAYEHQQVASSRLLGLESDLFSLRDHVTQLQVYGQMILQAASSVNSELDFAENRVYDLKALGWCRAQSGTRVHTPARDVEEGLGRSGMSPAVPDPPSPLSSLGESWESSNDESIGAVRRDSEALQAVSHPREMPGGVEGVVDLEDEEDGDIVDGFGLLTPVVLEGTSKYGLTDYFENWRGSPASLPLAGVVTTKHGSRAIRLSTPQGADEAEDCCAGGEVRDEAEDEIEAVLPSLSLKRSSCFFDEAHQHASLCAAPNKFIRQNFTPT